MIDNYLTSIKKQLEFAKSLGEKSIDQVQPAELFWQYNEQSNSIAIIVNHLHGNMMSRWTDFLTSDGEKDSRNRDQEFEQDIKTKSELLEKWNEGWGCVFKAIDSLNKENFSTLVYIRNQGHTITEAINRQVGHYSYHIGQIVFIAKMIQGERWKSLSIPKGQSKIYNAEKFTLKKDKTHFTDEFIK